MADDTNREIEPMNFHSCDTPRGMLYYNLDDLTKTQQTKLNDLRIKTVREDEQYLAGHPEIRACVALITRYVLQRCPRNNIHDVIAQFFLRSKVDIQEEINQYIKKRGDHICEMDSAVGVCAKHMSSMSSFEVSSLTSAKESLSDSLKNVDVDFEQLTHPPSGTLISSISEITDAGYLQSHDMDKVAQIIHAHQMEDLIITDILNKIHYDDEIEGDEFEGDEKTSYQDPNQQSISTKVSFSPVVHTNYGAPVQKIDPVNKEADIDKEAVQHAVDTIISQAANESENVPQENQSQSSRSSRPSIKFNDEKIVVNIGEETSEGKTEENTNKSSQNEATQNTQE